MNEVQRRVVCAAIRSYDGDLVLGIRHYSQDMWDQLKQRIDAEKFYYLSDNDQGFVDQFGIYMNRKQAYVVAKQANQIINFDACTNGKLYSEGLY